MAPLSQGNFDGFIVCAIVNLVVVVVVVVVVVAVQTGFGLGRFPVLVKSSQVGQGMLCLRTPTVTVVHSDRRFMTFSSGSRAPFVLRCLPKTRRHGSRGSRTAWWKEWDPGCGTGSYTVQDRQTHGGPQEVRQTSRQSSLFSMVSSLALIPFRPFPFISLFLCLSISAASSSSAVGHWEGTNPDSLLSVVLQEHVVMVKTRVPM